MRCMLFLLILIPLACGGDDDDDSSGAGEAAVRQFEMAVRGQWGPVWDEMHPGHQAIVDRDLYIRCQSEDTYPDYEITVDDVFEEAVEVPRLGQMDTTAVTLRFADGDDTEFLTSHLVDVEGEWKFFIQEDGLAAFEAGECP